MKSMSGFDAAIFLQARISSTRLPGKVLKKVYGKPLLGYLLDRLLTIGLPVWVLVPQVEREGFSQLETHYPSARFFGGSTFNVLERFHQATKAFPVSNYVRVTGDNPFTSIHCLQNLLKKHVEEEADLSYYRELPYGAGVEIISRRALTHTYRYAKNDYDLEHVTPWLHRQVSGSIGKSWRKCTPPAPSDYHRPEIRVSIDTSQDLSLFRKRVKKLVESGRPFSLRSLLTLE